MPHHVLDVAEARELGGCGDARARARVLQAVLHDVAVAPAERAQACLRGVRVRALRRAHVLERHAAAVAARVVRPVRRGVPPGRGQPREQLGGCFLRHCVLL